MKRLALVLVLLAVANSPLAAAQPSASMKVPDNIASGQAITLDGSASKGDYYIVVYQSGTKDAQGNFRVANVVTLETPLNTFKVTVPSGSYRVRLYALGTRGLKAAVAKADCDFDVPRGSNAPAPPPANRVMHPDAYGLKGFVKSLNIAVNDGSMVVGQVFLDMADRADQYEATQQSMQKFLDDTIAMVQANTGASWPKWQVAATSKLGAQLSAMNAAGNFQDMGQLKSAWYAIGDAFQGRY